MRIPTDAEIRALHEKYAPSPEAFESVYTHCRIVCEMAEQLIARNDLPVDVELVRAGCLLHDIGVYRLGDDAYIRHGVLGHELLAAEGFSETLRRFCSCHTGVGVTREDVRRQGLPIPEGDYVAESAEEELVMYADKFHSKSRPPSFVSAESYAGNVRRFGEEKVVAFKGMVERYGIPDLDPLMGRYGHGLR